MKYAKIINKQKIVNLLDALIEQYQVIAPVRQDDMVLFEQVASGSEATLEFSNTKMSAKEIFLPRSEVMFLFDGTQIEDPYTASARTEPPKRVLFGVRPCDARSLPLLDKVFDDPDDQDPYYVQRREDTYVVGMGCIQPLSTCFCTWVGGGPFSEQGLDVLLSDLGDRYLLETISEKGERLLEGNALLEGAKEADLREKERLVREAEERIGSSAVTEGLKEKLDGMYDDSFWADLHAKCLGCGVCTFLCPTCYCFDILDEGDGFKGQRVRIWDSCQFPLFTLHASGHNPRPSGRERMRQRVMHKFRYFVDNYGEIACVGCGRCIQNCPVNMDIRQVLHSIIELPLHEAR